MNLPVHLSGELEAYTCPPMEDSYCVRNCGTVFSIFGYWYTGGDIFRYDPVKRQKMVKLP